MVISYQKIAKKWQKRWEKAKIFEANIKPKKKIFITIPYPYVNGGPHIGAGFTFLRGDVYARFKRMEGFNVLFPQGFHATGQPILGALERLKQGDEIQISTFKLYGASNRDLENFVRFGPEFVAQYWMKRWIEDLKSIGYSADWKRTFITAISPHYNRFIQWQYNILKEKGYVTQGTHPVIWCPHCKSPTGDHDRLEGIGESPLLYVLIKFKLDSGEILPCGTLRPETVYGVTNIWVSPSEDYVKAKVDNEVWIMSKACAEKLENQLKKVKIIGKIRGDTLVGKWVENPVTKDKILILPAIFVDPFSASGIVMSVPSHAPYDWAGLYDLQKDPSQLKRYGFGLREKVKEIKPISIIKLEGFGEHPAIEICEKMGIGSSREKEKLDLATAEIYKKEFHLGILKANCGAYAGKKVSEVKEELINRLVNENSADLIWETTGPVICRCTTRCHVKILENQWFLKFSDEKWKEKVRSCIERMEIYPEEVRHQFLNTVEWLKDKACTRKTGLGTKLPWDKEWIVETLSDSTIYMAFYTIAHLIKEIPANKLTNEVFDYIFLGKGGSKKNSKKTKISEKLLKQMRREFVYWYPVDLRSSGKDLIQNHLTFYLFHHTAIWENKKFWPKGIAVNGFVQVGGEKMSKSLGNILPLRNLVKQYGSDLVRINIVSSNEGLDDADWREETLPVFRERIEFILNLIKNLKKAGRRKMQNIDYYLLSKLQNIIKRTTRNYEELKFRSVTQIALFESINELKFYLERCGGLKKSNKKTLEHFLSVIVRLLTPLIPHVCEEMWSKLGYKNFVSIAEWPKYERKLVNKKSEMKEELLKTTLEDIREIEKITKIKPSKISIIIAPAWKFRVYNLLRKNRDISIKSILKKIKTEEPREVINYVNRLRKKNIEFGEILSKRSQREIFTEAKDFFERIFECKFEIEDAEKSKVEKAKQADVLKPAIFLS
jgi:leucyl-tRNA synthetase